MSLIVLIVAIIFAATAYDIVNGVRAKGETTGRAWQAFAAGFFLGPIGLIIAWMMRGESLRKREIAALAPAAPPVSPEFAPEGMKKCPECAEIIQGEARKC